MDKPIHKNFVVILFIIIIISGIDAYRISHITPNENNFNSIDKLNSKIDSIITSFPSTLLVHHTTYDTIFDNNSKIIEIRQNINKQIIPDSIELFNKYVKSHIAYIESQQIQLINDIRQETNNNINKINGWFGFWIAVLSVLCGIIPIMLQYKQSNDLTQKYRSNQNRLDKELNRLNRELDRLEVYKDNLKQDMATELNRISSTINNNNLNSYINSICLNLDNRVIVDDTLRRNIKSTVFKMVIETLEEIEHDLFNDKSKNLSLKKDGQLIIILIHLSTLLDRVAMSSKKRNINALNLQKEIASIFNDILGNSKYDSTYNGTNIMTYKKIVRLLKTLNEEM